MKVLKFYVYSQFIVYFILINLKDSTVLPMLKILSLLLDTSLGIPNIFGFIISLIFSVYVIKSVKYYLLNFKSTV